MRRRVQGHTNAQFQVFVDSPTVAVPSEHHTQCLDVSFPHDSTTLSKSDAAQSATDKAKPFTLSPRSQVNAQKENFDLVKMQLVSCGRAK
ncbi:hypothetical protein H4R20_003323, partial [Coemansia guatemalensis]